MKIIFDFDHTLFSTSRLHEFNKDRFKKLGVSEELFLAAFKKSKNSKNVDSGYYRPWRHFKLIAKSDPWISKRKLEEEFRKVLRLGPKFLYADTLPFLRKFKKKFRLIIVSYGDKKFQSEKIIGAGIKKYFWKIFITQDTGKIKPLKGFLKKNEKAIFVDDNPAAFSPIKKTFPQIITVRINRGEGRYREAENNANIDFAVRNLKELEKILNK